MRLDVPSGQSIRFEAGDERDVELVGFGGHRRIVGFNGLFDGAVSSQSAEANAMRRAEELGFSANEDGRSAQ
jgi:Urease beta subunit